MRPINADQVRASDIARRKRMEETREFRPFIVLHLTPGHSACARAQSLAGTRQALDEMPNLPIEGCEAERCMCFITSERR